MILPAVYAVCLYAQAAPAAKPNPAIIEVQLRWSRLDPAATAGAAAPEPVLLFTPRLTTTDGQVASIELKAQPGTPAGKGVFFVSLSPTLEPVDNSAKAGEVPGAAKGPTVRMLWSLRVSDNTFPGGVQSVALTGASRLVIGDAGDAVVARFSLADPTTGLVTEYRLTGQATVGETAQKVSAPPVTTPPPAP